MEKKRLNRMQRKVATDHGLIPNEWLLIKETIQYYQLVNKQNGRHKFLEKAMPVEK